MFINHIVSYCNFYYTEPGKCDNCHNICNKDCQECLDAINYRQTDKRQYNCYNIVYFYVCKYIYKYSSEIDHLCQSINLSSILSEYHILSIGCGPATELYGMINYMAHNNNYKKITYVGFDLNNIWNSINNQTIKFIKANIEKSVIIFSNKDVFAIFPSLKERWYPNIIILNYVISDMVRCKYDIKSFFQALLNNIIFEMMDYSVIILNDINHFKARDYYDELLNLVNKYFEVDYYEFHFSHNKPFFKYGIQHPYNCITEYITPEISIKYSPWIFCTSAQLFIQFRRR